MTSELMNSYMNLIGELANLDRCHCGPEMDRAFQKLVEYYPGSRLLSYDRESKINHWELPPWWSCEIAELRDDTGKLLASKSRHNLEVFSYSPSVDVTVTLDELQEHLLSDPNRPDSVLFHFRNQYRHWAPQWGFSIPHKVRESLSKDARYHALIKSCFVQGHKLVQSDFFHQGACNDQFLLLGHFDHPSQVNDGLAGCIAAYEVIKRLKDKKTKYSYRAFASVEIVGSVAYLANEAEVREKAQEALFMGFCGIEAPLIYQQSFHQHSLIDRIIKFLFLFGDHQENKIFEHRALIGNDENVFDSVGYEIPTGTLMRWPFPHYHTDKDNIAITKESSIEEIVNFTLQIINIIEKNQYLNATYSGLPSLANPAINLYLSTDSISGLFGFASSQISTFDSVLSKSEKIYLQANPDMFNRLMQNIVRLSDGKHTILDIAEKSLVPFNLVYDYALRLESKGLVRLQEERV